MTDLMFTFSALSKVAYLAVRGNTNTDSVKPHTLHVDRTDLPKLKNLCEASHKLFKQIKQNFPLRYFYGVREEPEKRDLQMRIS